MCFFSFGKPVTNNGFHRVFSRSFRARLCATNAIRLRLKKRCDVQRAKRSRPLTRGYQSSGQFTGNSRRFPIFRCIEMGKKWTGIVPDRSVGRDFPRKKPVTGRGSLSRTRNLLPYVRWNQFFLLVSTGPIYAVEVCSLKPEAHPVYAYLFSVSSFSRCFERGPARCAQKRGRERAEGVESSRGKRVGGGGWNAPAKKSRENHESKPLIRVAAGTIGPTNADRWVSMETRICPLGPYVPTSSRLSVVGVSAT